MNKQDRFEWKQIMKVTLSLNRNGYPPFSVVTKFCIKCGSSYIFVNCH